VAFPSPVADWLGVAAPELLGAVVGFGLLVGGVVGAVEDPVGPVDGVVEGVLGALGVEPEVDGVDGVVLGVWPPDPDEFGDESGFCEGVVSSCVPFPPGFSGAGWLFEPPLRPGSLVNTLLW